MSASQLSVHLEYSLQLRHDSLLAGNYEGVMDLWWNPSIAELVVAFQASALPLIMLSENHTVPRSNFTIIPIRLP
jgi:hypothetical protein